jgi:purine nucleoside phosphorylase
MPAPSTHQTPIPPSALQARTANQLRALLPDALARPRVAIVCGSGLGGLAATVEREPVVSVKYEDVEGFPKSTGIFSLFAIRDFCFSSLTSSPPFLNLLEIALRSGIPSLN